MIKQFALSFLLFIVSYTVVAQQGGGMWIPTELNEQEMKAMGMKIDAKDIFNTNKPSIKDAIVHFGGGCTGEMISDKGLLLTNHHCGYGQIQAHSTLENDYLKNGFWAADLKTELKNEGLTATFYVDILDVTNAVLNGVTSEMTEEQRQTIVKTNIETVISQVRKESYQDVTVRPYYKGNKYYQIITETYRDVRLVGAPPSSIGNFGMDTDNWVWPRHTGDFSVFRIYAGKDNKPANYSPDNVPYKPKHYLPISIKGIEQDDFTFVFGFPGVTDEYLPAKAIDITKSTINPSRIGIRSITLDILDKKMRTDDETRIKYASKFARISNSHKRWIGEKLGLEKSNAVEKREAYEKEFLSRVYQNPKWKTQYGTILNQLNTTYQDHEKYWLGEVNYVETFYQNSESFRTAIVLINLLDNESKAEYPTVKERTIRNLRGLYKNYDTELDEAASLALYENYLAITPAEFLPRTKNDLTPEILKNAFANSVISGKKAVNRETFSSNIDVAAANDALLLETLKSDPLIQIVKQYKDVYEQQVSPDYLANQAKLSGLMRTYMKAQLEVFAEKKIFPDANSTLRVTYGKVDGYNPRDAVKYEPVTYLDGVIEKYVPDDYEFDLSDKLIELYNTKDFGRYAKNGRLPVNFIATNHTTGGNSGSPALDAKGNLIGLNFDRVWEGTMSDLNYDPEICRNIMVDARYILFIIDKFANSQHIMKELRVVE